MPKKINISDLTPEIDIQTARSGGPGGQNVNKVETKVMLRFHPASSNILNEKQKGVISEKLKGKLTNDGFLIVQANNERSQFKNKEIAFKKLDQMLEKAFQKKKTRKPAKPSKAAKAKRLRSKKMHGEKKKLRGKVNPE